MQKAADAGPLWVWEHPEKWVGVEGAGGDDVSQGRYWTLQDEVLGDEGKTGSLCSRGKWVNGEKGPGEDDS